jgi:integrase
MEQTLEEVRQFERRHPIGTKARLALALLLFTGQRRSDITRLGRQHVRDGKITFTQFKGRNRKPKRLILPIVPALQQVRLSLRRTRPDLRFGDTAAAQTKGRVVPDGEALPL